MVACGYCGGNHPTGDMSAGCTGSSSRLDFNWVSEGVTFTLDHVLCYVDSYVDCSTSGQLKCVLLKHFSDMEISIAKERLYGVINAIFKDPKKRIGPEKKSNEIDDILKGFTELELRQRKHEFGFAARDAKRMPKFSPEEYNVSDILSRLSLLEQQMSSANKDISALKVKSVVQVPPNPVQPSTARVLPPRTNSQHPPRHKAVTDLRSRNDSVSSKRTLDDLESEGEWEKPKKKRHKKKAVSGSPSSKAKGLKGGDKYGEIFISHVVKDTKVEDVTEFLQSIDCAHEECEKVSNENSKFDSFRVKLKEEFCVKLTSDEAKDLLPTNVMCRRYYRSKQRGGSFSDVKND